MTAYLLSTLHVRQPHSLLNLWLPAIRAHVRRAQEFSNRASSSGNMQAVTFGDSIPGYEIGDKSAPAVIVLQEWWGINDLIKTHATNISVGGGYRCLIPDLYKGKIGVDKEEAAHLMGNLDFKAATVELTQSVEYLKSTGSGKVGCVGFCMGGALTFCAAQHSGVDCAAAFYGTPGSPEVCIPEEIKVPLQGHFGVLDSLKGFSDVETAKGVESRMKAAGCPSDFFYYEGAGHAFMNEGEDADAKRNSCGFPHPPAEARDVAWTRVFEFFNAHLKN